MDCPRQVRYAGAMGKGRLIVILTGEREVGKSTLCRQVAEHLRGEGMRVGGVLTQTEHQGAERTLTVHDLADDSHMVLARTHAAFQGLKHGAFTFSPDGVFFGIKAIGRGMTADLLIVDEIGPFEMDGGGFFPVLHVVRKASRSLLVVRPSLIERAAARIGLDHYEVAMLAGGNHEQTAEHLGELFLEHYRRANTH